MAMAENTSSFIVDLVSLPHKDSSYILYFDTNFFINALAVFSDYRKKFHSYHTTCNKFLERIDPSKKRNDNILCFTSSFALYELFWFVMKQDILKTMKEKKIIERISPEVFYKDDPAIVHRSFDKIESIKKDLDAFPIYILEPQKDISSEMLRLIKEYDLLPGDAYHIAIAQSHKIDKIVAIDEDFGRPAIAEEFTLYTPNYKLLNS